MNKMPVKRTFIVVLILIKAHLIVSHCPEKIIVNTSNKNSNTLDRIYFENNEDCNTIIEVK